MNEKKEFWIKNITGLRVSLKDLRLIVPPYTSMNLLSKNFRYSEEELIKSLESGSLFVKRDKIKKRETILTKPEELLLLKQAEQKVNKKAPKLELSKKILPSKEKAAYSLIDIKNESFSELEIDTSNTDKFVEQFINSDDDE